jgi:terminase small subunit-like protein
MTLEKTVKNFRTEPGTERRHEKVPAIVDAEQPLADARHETFARRLAAGASHRDAFEAAGYKGSPNALSSHASRLASVPAVQGRIRALQRAAATEATFDVREHMQRLSELALGDVGEWFTLVIEPCKACYPPADAEALLAAAFDGYCEAIGRGDVASPPSTDTPRTNCLGCLGHGVTRHVVKPSDEVSAAGRRLVKSIKQKGDGSIELTFIDQLGAHAQLAQLAGWIVDKSMALHATVPASTLPKATPENVLDAFHALRGNSK